LIIVDLKISVEDMDGAFKEIRPSAMREVSLFLLLLFF